MSFGTAACNPSLRGVNPVFTFMPLYLGTGIFGWLLFLLILDWLNN